MTCGKIISITLDAHSTPHMALPLKNDCIAALHDLQCDSFFLPHNDAIGGYSIILEKNSNKLIFNIKNRTGCALPLLVLSLTPYRRLIKDYFMIIQSYDDAMRQGYPERLQTIDMARRGLHNEGATLLQERLADKIEMDFVTARRLFTLICVLHTNTTNSFHI